MSTRCPTCPAKKGRGEGVPCFVKQLGAVTVPLEDGIRFVAHTDLAGVRAELDVRQYPAQELKGRACPGDLR